VGVVSKVKIATVLVRFFRLSRILAKLYPIAIKVEFGEVDVKRLLGLVKTLQPKCEISTPLKRFGSQNDGGYLLIDNLEQVSGVLSFGIGDNNSFDLEVAQFVPFVEMYDHTIVEAPRQFSNGKFNRIGISAFPSNGFTTIEEILSKIPLEANLILKIDIEGAEWEVFDNISMENLLRFSQIVGEFHDLFKYFKDESFSEVVDRVMRKLESTHVIFNSHPNTWARHEVISGVNFPDVLEINFVRDDFTQRKDFKVNKVSVPNFPNNPNADEVFFLNI
jgi:hypothetical protein